MRMALIYLASAINLWVSVYSFMNRRRVTGAVYLFFAVFAASLAFSADASATTPCEAAKSSLSHLTSTTRGGVVCATIADREAVYPGNTAVGGWFQPTTDTLYVMNHYDYELTRQVILHEYGHHLDYMAGQRMSPIQWFATDTRPDYHIEWFAQAYTWLYNSRTWSPTGYPNPLPTDAQIAELTALGWLPATYDDEQIARLYLASFQRPSDAGGMTYWKQQRNFYDYPLSSMANFFATSDEFHQRYGSLNNSDFVTRIYLNVLGRWPDAAGHAYWYDFLHTHTRGELVLGFSESPEFIERTMP